MFTKKLLKGLATIVSTTIFSMSTIQSAYAAPGNLATAPLFLSTIVEPNVFFTIDDSGSMDWNPMVADGTAGLTASGGLPRIDGERRAYYAHSFSRLYDEDDDYYVLPPADGTRAQWDLGWVVRNHVGNLNYYNPNVTYNPWSGTKSDGSPLYTDADPTNALKDPFNPGGESVDLTRSYNITAGDARDIFDRNMAVNNFWIAVYFVWNDDGDGVIEQSDGRTRVVIPTDSPGEMQNFANWFQYHRSRINATKSIIGTTINNTDASRMGMRMFNRDQVKDVESMSDAAKKRDLLNAFYDHNIRQRSTPMRRSLEETGDYFQDNGGGAPILSAANGGECQQNFNILMGDGFWNGGSPGVGNRDINGGDGNTPFDGNAAQSNDGGNYADSWSDTLADVAMDNYERDLRTDLANNVPTTPGIDEADHQHLVTYTIAFGIEGGLDLSIDPTATSVPGPAFSGWPDPAAGDAEKVDDMWHAAYNGRGQFFSAQQPDELEIALNAAIANIAERTATSSAVAFSSAKLTTDTTVYLAEFNTNRWQGDLFAFKIDPDTGDLAATSDWSAGTQLVTRNLTANPREILTHDGTTGVPFRWANLNTTQEDDLKTSPTGIIDPDPLVADAIGQARLAYLRGDRSDEGTGYFFRQRLSILGDLVNSGPVYVGKPALNWPDTAPFPNTSGSLYSEFKNGAAASRDGMVYAAANDGMLHAFAEADGSETMAYIPNILFSTGLGQGMHYLTDQNYGHKYYNDLTPTVSDIYANLGTGAKWQTVLIGGLRGGGRGIYALNVTDPGAFTESNAADLVLWEFTSNDDANLGHTYSQPQIAMANNGRWVAIFGNGYNDLGDGEAKLYILDIEAGLNGWVPGDYKVISTGSGSAIDRNGLATPRLADIDGNGTVDRVYAGDLKGDMWAFDMGDTDSTFWTIPGSAPLFTTVGGLPITSKPVLAKHPTEPDSGTNYPNIMVFFGSGQYLTNADKTTTDVNYFYGVWDQGASNLNNSDLVRQDYDNTFNPFRVLTNNPVNYAGGDDGWYFDLRDTGERTVVAPAVRGDLVLFNTFVPESDPCSSGGYGWRFAVDLATGGSPLSAASDTNGDGVIDSNDAVNNGTDDGFLAATSEQGFLSEDAFIGKYAYASDKKKDVPPFPEIPRGRFGWQELIQ
jgi:type IV pilus assembly protein PilY1